MSIDIRIMYLPPIRLLAIDVRWIFVIDRDTQLNVILSIDIIMMYLPAIRWIVMNREIHNKILY